MKMRTFVYPLLTLMLLLGSCDKEDHDDPVGPEDAEALRSTAQSGDWTITYYFDTDKEETSDFAGYVFTFTAQGVVTASNGTNGFTGSWSVSVDDSSDDSPDDDVDFNLFFSEPFLADELNDDWDVLEFSSTRIALRDVSGGDGDTDLLTFEKN